VKKQGSRVRAFSLDEYQFSSGTSFIEGSVCQGTASVVPKKRSNGFGFSRCENATDENTFPQVLKPAFFAAHEAGFEPFARSCAS
jgi:hypothetical protein